MKLHVKFEMEIDEEPIREAFQTASAQESAIALRAVMMVNMEESLDAICAENVSVKVDVVEDTKV